MATARLIVIAGPLEGMVFPLTEAETTLGRETTNQICLLELSVSRLHCAIQREGDEYHLHDRDSLNATFINGLPIKQQQLKSGDRIRLGNSLLLFVCEPEPLGEAPVQVRLSDSQLITGQTMLLSPDGALSFPSMESPVVSLKPSRSTRDLGVLLELSLLLSSVEQPDELAQRLLAMIGAAIPAERGAILLIEENPEEFAAIYGWRRHDETGAPVAISRTVAQRVLRERTALLSNNVQLSPTYSQSPSLSSLDTTALLAVPLVAAGRALGLIYLDVSDPETHFDQDHLHLLSVVAGLAAGALENLRRVGRLERENRRLHAEISIEHDMIGVGARMMQVYQFISKVAPTEATVLICGESGTGKELVARAMHANSPRAAKSFAAINCAALTETLLESELFGYEKGAFTGATALKKGKLEAADGGTVFLDEIGELPMLLQAKLLRVLQQREFERVGGTRTIKADIRLLAATNRHLEQAIKEGRFREDLYYRLNVLTLTLPPLRERREDLRALTNHFITKYGQRCNRRIAGIAPPALACLMRYDWPGNVREFENAIERAVVLGSGEVIQVEDLPEAIIEGGGETSTIAPLNFYDAVNEAKKQLIIKALAQADGSYTEAARLLGFHPNHLHRLIRNLNMKAELRK